MADDRPDISICIVNWNGRKLLLDLLASIEQVRGEVGLESIVVDNGSVDGSVQGVREAFSDVEVVANAQNLGFARANNQAAERARGRYLLFLNNDTVVRAGALRKLADFLDRTPTAVAVAPKLIGTDGAAQQTVRALPTLAALLDRVLIVKWTRLFREAYRTYREGGFDPNRGGAVAQVAAAAILVRREAFDAVGGWDEGFVFGVEDVDLCARLGRLGEIHYLPQAEIEHLGRVSSRANRAFVYRAYECGYARYLRKHHTGRWRLGIYKLLVTLDLPVRIVLLTGAAAINRLRGRQDKAQRYGQRARAAAGFAMMGLGAFWRS